MQKTYLYPTLLALAKAVAPPLLGAAGAMLAIAYPPGFNALCGV